ncbi:MAG: hypothetical protein KGH89_06805 [Thaumarchaeota archaeon]|nr:hypothetical protein [Nitrososphaerota archaeon]MDE1867615.1 hypothetical protein [Nitrososphaerota archaeon]
MSAKTIGIILAGFVGGVIAIGIAMSAGSGWEQPGTYTGVSNAAHTVNDSAHCYAFQTGCSVSNYGTTTSASDNSGAALSGSYGGP